MKKGFYFKAEIARMYFPNIAPESAVRTLRRWMAQCPDLNAALAETGYLPTQRYLTLQQVELIFRFFGHP